ncbi:Rap1a/Tai family immunity protein [Corallibacter sp.]|uniref:Rap1a/Tai family immunity protein n=1 Tax=Corallibacter sp. TaxID=2038084 RepID=UPI003AB31D74
MMTSGSILADGNKLLDQCQVAMHIMNGQSEYDRIDAMKFGLCVGFASGVKSTLMVLPSSVEICWPKEGITNGQATRILYKYLKDNPQKLHENETLLAMLSMSEAFACK